MDYSKELPFVICTTATKMCNPDLYSFECLESHHQTICFVRCVFQNGVNKDDARNYLLDVVDLISKMTHYKKHTNPLLFDDYKINQYIVKMNGEKKK